MEQGMTRYPSHRGFMLVTVLIITAVGLLFGAGALLLFRYQCQLRIDRQHELEKVYAVRSALNCIAKDITIPEDGIPLDYYTSSERDLRLIVKPVQRIFPDFDNPMHLDIGDEGGHGRLFRIDGNELQWNKNLDYEYGAERWNEGECETNLLKYISNSYDNMNGLAFSGLAETNHPKWWVNIGMNGTGGWLHEAYGRRYCFQMRNHVAESDSELTKDIIRLCLVRNATNDMAGAGRRLGWPLSRPEERALVLEMRKGVGGDADDDNAILRLDEYGSQGFLTNLIYWSDNIPSINFYVGMQIANDKVSLFYNSKIGEGSALSRGYVFSPTRQMSNETYSWFENGCERDSEGEIIRSPELRAVFEIEAASAKRPDRNSTDSDFLTCFRVSPAYQYDIFIEHPSTVTNRATVAQKVFLHEGDGRGVIINAVRTYDTHGTENKGFRKDEKDWAAKRRGGK